MPPTHPCCCGCVRSDARPLRVVNAQIRALMDDPPGEARTRAYGELLEEHAAAAEREMAEAA